MPQPGCDWDRACESSVSSEWASISLAIAASIGPHRGPEPTNVETVTFCKLQPASLPSGRGKGPFPRSSRRLYREYAAWTSHKLPQVIRELQPRSCNSLCGSGGILLVWAQSHSLSAMDSPGIPPPLTSIRHSSEDDGALIFDRKSIETRSSAAPFYPNHQLESLQNCELEMP